MIIPMWLAKTIAWCGVALIVLALLDVGLAFFGLYITGSKWSSILWLAGGFVIRWFGESLDED